jgi:serine-type D-Ala-D-Ala carboxypeptidase/endopeptidase (penicillin-binding protein 4)
VNTEFKLLVSSGLTTFFFVHGISPVAAGPLLDDFLGQVRANNLNPQLQGILLVDQEGRILEGNQAQALLPAASITKLATTLAVIDRWGVDHQFETRIYGDGPIEAGVLQGNLYIQGGQDPFFMWQGALDLAHQLDQLGIQQVQGDLVVEGPFWMNFSTDSLKSAASLKTALDSSQWTPKLWDLNGPYGAPKIHINGSVRTGMRPVATGEKPLAVHASRPLWKVVKQMNNYSSNIMAKFLGETLGGARGVEQQLRNTYPNIGSFTLQAASGLGRENKFSTESIVFIINALEKRMKISGMNLTDVMAVKGMDPGTLARRGMPDGVVAKTGTLNKVSCLAGVVQTGAYGPLRFVLLNQGSVFRLRKLQDWFLRLVQYYYGGNTNLVSVPSQNSQSEKAIADPASQEGEYIPQ